MAEILSLVPRIESDRVDAADVSDIAVCKTPRSGFTTTAIKEAHRNGHKVLIVSPTKRILDDTVRNTVEEIGGVYCSIPGNQSCIHVRRKIETDRFLSEIPIPRGKCSDCGSYEFCPVTEIERISDFTVVGMTYAKLEAITMSKKEAERVGKKLADIDLVLFEEAHTISFPELPKLDLDTNITWPKEFGFVLKLKKKQKPALFKVYDNFCWLRKRHRRYVDQIKSSAESNPEQYAGFRLNIPYPSSPAQHHFQMDELLSAAEARKELWPKEIADDQVRALKNIVSIMASNAATISYIKNGDTGKMIITGGQGNIEFAIYSFLKEIVPEAKVCFASSTLIESRPGYFSELADREITTAIFPDVRNTNAKMHIHPSRWRFSDYDGEDGIARAVKEIREIYETLGHRPIYLWAMNEWIRDQLKKELEDCGNILFDYYRSENTMGVGVSQRISIAVGLAQTPRHSCDPLAKGDEDQERYIHSQQLRLNEVHAATWQAWSRVKDPNGEFESHVYCVGVRAEEISDVVTWGINRRITTTTKDNGKYEWSVKVDKELDRPIVHAEERTSRGLNRHSIDEYVDRAVPVKALIDYRRNSEKSTQSPYILGTSRENVDSLWNSETLSLHNHLCREDELEATSFSMAMLFTGRQDSHACQSEKPGKNGKYGFRKRETTTDIVSLITGHLNGSETIGFYPFDDEDQCYYCAIEIKERGNAMKLSRFLQDNDLPLLIEKLASPEEYHIWIPIIPTKTRTVHKFAK
jgi:hypothetical protein